MPPHDGKHRLVVRKVGIGNRQRNAWMPRARRKRKRTVRSWDSAPQAVSDGTPDRSEQGEKREPKVAKNVTAATAIRPNGLRSLSGRRTRSTRTCSVGERVHERLARPHIKGQRAMIVAAASTPTIFNLDGSAQIRARQRRPPETLRGTDEHIFWTHPNLGSPGVWK